MPQVLTYHLTSPLSPYEVALLLQRGNPRNHRDGAQTAEDPPDPQRIGDRLTQTVLFRDLKVDHGGGFITADLNGVYNEIGTVKSGDPVKMLCYLGVGAVVLVSTGSWSGISTGSTV